MKKRQIFHLGFLCLFLTFSSGLSANIQPDFQIVKSLDYCFNGGVTVAIQGLTSTPIEVTFPNEREGSLVTITIYNNTGGVLYQETTFETDFDYTSLNLPEGEKTLVIEVGGAVETIVFE